MKRHWLHGLLVFSLLLNVGVLGAVGYQAWRDREWPEASVEGGHDRLADYLKLNEEQRVLWQEKEKKFMREMSANWEEIRAHRERLIRQIFAHQPDVAAIEAERAAISHLQERQQRHVIDQLMEEQRMLNANQRETLAGLLIRQTPAGSLEERLHSD